MNRNHNKKWVQLETMLFETPEKVRGPQTAKASSKLGLPKNQIFKFIRTNHPEGHQARSLNALQIPETPEKDKSLSKFNFDTDSRGNIDSKNTADSRQNVDSRNRIPGSFNSIDEDLPEPMSSDYKPTRASKFKRGTFLSPDASSKKIQTVVITSRNSKKKYSMNTEYSSSLNNLERQYKISDPICGIDEIQFQVLFKKKCEDMDITGYAETEEKFITNIRKKSLGTKLCFPESGFGKTALTQLGAMISGNLEASQLQLRKSYLSGEGLMVPFCKSLMNMPNLIHLDLANNALESQEFVVLFAALKRIQTLVSIDISNYEPDKKNKMGVDGVEAFCGFVKNNVALQYVTLSNLMLEDNAVKSIISALQECPNLLILDLTSNVFSGSCLTELTGLAAQTSVIKINLANNKLKKEAAENLAKFIQAQRKDDKDVPKEARINREGLELILENTNLGPEIDMILESLGRGSNIKKLNFSRNLLADIEIAHFETALSENRKLMELDLSDCKLGEIQGKMLALGMKKNKYLKSLNLGNNNLGDEAGSLIIYSILNNHSLQSIDLAQNRLGPETAKALQEVIKKNPNLTKYNLIYNNFDEADGYLLQEGLFFNAKITQFNIAYTRVKFNTLEAIEGIVKDNLHKLQFAAVPSLKDEVGKRVKYVEEEKHHMGLVGEFEKKKEEINRDVKRFKETLTDLKGREKSPTYKKKERLVLKLSKDIKEEQPKLEEINAQIREFQTQAQLEKESYMRLIEAQLQEVEKAEKRIVEKQAEIDKLKQKYDPEIKILKYECSKLADEIRFNEMYNQTVVDKIKNQKEIITIQTNIMNPKVSDVFLATSELAKAKKKAMETQSPEKPPNSGTKLNSPEEEKENDKISAGMDMIRKTRQNRADKLIEEAKKKQDAKTRRKLRRMASKSDNSKQEQMRLKINEKLSKMFKEDKSRLEPVSENEIKD